MVDIISDGDEINRWVFYPTDFSADDHLLDITETFPFEAKGGRRMESLNLSRLLQPYPEKVHALGGRKAEKRREFAKLKGKEIVYEYEGFLVTSAGKIRAIQVKQITLDLYVDPVEDPDDPNPGHVTIEMLNADGFDQAKAARILVKDKLAEAFGTDIIRSAKPL